MSPSQEPSLDVPSSPGRDELLLIRWWGEAPERPRPLSEETRLALRRIRLGQQTRRAAGLRWTTARRVVRRNNAIDMIHQALSETV
jgi:hypothetical protein